MAEKLFFVLFTINKTIMFFKSLVECLIKKHRNSNDALSVNAFNALAREMEKDLLQAYCLGRPLVEEHPILFWRSNSFLDFLIKLSKLPSFVREREPFEDVPGNVDFEGDVQELARLKAHIVRLEMRANDLIAQLENRSPDSSEGERRLGRLRVAQREVLELQERIQERIAFLGETPKLNFSKLDRPTSGESQQEERLEKDSIYLREIARFARLPVDEKLVERIVDRLREHEEFNEFVKNILFLFPEKSFSEMRKKLYEGLKKLHEMATSDLDEANDDWLNITVGRIKFLEMDRERVRDTMNDLVELASDIPSQFKQDWKVKFIERYMLLNDLFKMIAKKTLGTDIPTQATQDPNIFFKDVVVAYKNSLN